MKVVRFICCGADIHKNLIVATIAKTSQDGITEYIQRQFSTQNYDLRALKGWLLENECYEFAMESTGKYWIPVFNILEDKIKVYLVHPKYTKSIKGKKTDKKDSKWIADLFKCDLVKNSFIPPKDIREIRELCRYRIKLINIRSGERNRYQNSMTMCNIGLASILSDPFGKSANAIMKSVLENEELPKEEDIEALLNKTAKKKAKEVFKSIEGCDIKPDQRAKMKVASDHMQKLDELIAIVENEIYIRCAPYSDIIERLVTVPGVSYISAMTILGEIGADMSQFDCDKQLSSWAGLAPANNESAYKKKSVRISKAGAYLKPILVQCALAAIKTRGSYLHAKYENIKRRRGHKKAIIAIARKILVSIYHMIITGEVYNPVDYDTYNKPKSETSKNKNSNITVEEALELLKSKGYNTDSLQITSTNS